MTDTPEPPETPNEDDLQSLMGGLDFTPDWAKESPGVKSVREHGRDRSRSSGRGPRAPKRSSREKLQGVRVKPRRDAPSGGGGGGGNRDWDNRPARSRGDRPPRPPRVPVHVDFIPDKKRLSKVVAVIRQTRRVFPLRVVAEKFMENPAFLAMKYTVKKPKGGEEKDADFELYVCRADGVVFSDRAACEAYILDHGIEAYYESEIREVDAPKGAFPCVGRHGKSGRLIGPPNWHGYQARVDEIRQEVDPGCPPEVFARQIEMMRDEESIEAWKTEASQVVFYRPKPEEKPVEEPEPTKPGPEPAPEPEASTEAPAETPETESESPEPESPDPEAPSVEEASVEGTSPGEPAPGPGAESDPKPETPAVDVPFDMTREQVEAEFREKHLPRLLKATHRAIMPGVMLDRLTDPSLQSLTQFHLRRETDRPNSIIFALRPAFKHMRLRVYRHDGELMVSSVEPHPLPEDMNVTPEIRQILDHVATNPLCNAKQALEAVARNSEEITPDLVSHFRWLIEKGHLIEFHDETLLVPATRS